MMYVRTTSLKRSQLQLAGSTTRVKVCSATLYLSEHTDAVTWLDCPTLTAPGCRGTHAVAWFLQLIVMLEGSAWPKNWRGSSQVCLNSSHDRVSTEVCDWSGP